MREKDKKVVVTVCKGDCCRFGGDYKPILPTPAQLQRMVELGLSSPIGYVTVKEESEHRKMALPPDRSGSLAAERRARSARAEREKWLDIAAERRARSAE